MGTDKKIKLHIVTDIKIHIKMQSTRFASFFIALFFSLTLFSVDGNPTCTDEQSPCKCEAKMRYIVSKSGHPHEFMEHICSEDQDTAMLKKLKKAGLNMECKQLKTNKVLTHCKKHLKHMDGLVVQKVGCELRYSDL